MYKRQLHVRCVFLYDQHDDSLKEMAWHLQKLQHLENLRFSCDKLSPSEANALQATLSTLKRLKTLDLSHLWLGDAPAHFLRFLSSMEQLQQLDMSSCNLVHLHAAETLAEMLPKATGLKALKLNRNPLRDDSVQALAAVLQSMPCLEQLALSGSDVTNEGANAVVSALDSHPAIVCCDLRENIFVHRKLLPPVQRKGWLLVDRR